MGIFIGLDIGGTKFMAAAADPSGKILKRTRASAGTNLESDLQALNQMVESVAEGETIQGIGVAVGGPLNWQEGVVSPLHQPHWRNVPLKKILEERWNCHCYLDVDTNIGALGEYYSSVTLPRRFLYITLSTGMGGGFLVDGQIYRGKNGLHPEIAHQSIHYHCANPAGLKCECGAPDCLEALVSGNGIRRIYGKSAEHLTPEEWSEVAYNFGQGLRNIAAILTPDWISVGGGVAVGGGEAFIEQARLIMQANLYLVPAPEVKLSRLGYDTALRGAIAVAIHGIQA